MGTSASSALRADTASDGFAYGSLEGLGGGARKLKKKPVLVLDPDELAQAHAMFHEASAELLGEDVERAPRPAAILGLAPMDNDDEADEPDLADDTETEVEADMPSPEAVLSLTRRKTAPLPLDEPAAEEHAENQDAPSPMMDDVPIVERIEDGLDMATRIFPSLSLRPAEQDEGAVDHQDAGAEESFAPVASPPEPKSKREEPELPEPKARAPQLPAATPPQSVPPVNVQPRPAAPKDDFTFTPAPPSPPKTKPAPTPAAETVAASVPAPPPKVERAPEISERPAPATEPAAPAPIASDIGPRPARFDELNPEKDYDTPEEVYDLDSWLADPQEDNSQATSRPEPQQRPEPEPEQLDEPSGVPASEADDTDSDSDSDDFTVTDDDRVDGYAFMRDPRSRRSAIASAQQGRQSALRAKLLREAEENAAKAQRKQASSSPVMAFWAWLKGLFAPKG